MIDLNDEEMLGDEEATSSFGLDDDEFDFFNSLPIDVLEALQRGEMPFIFDGQQQHPLEAISQCIQGVVESLAPLVIRTCAASILQFAILAIIRNQPIAHLLNGLIGICLLWTNLAQFHLMLPSMLYFIFSYALINAKFGQNKGILCIIFTIFYIIICQMLMEPANFLAIRGGWMIAAMKQISLCMDLDSEGSPLAQSHPTITAQFAYIFNPSTLPFGPFITFGQFQKMQQNVRELANKPRALFIQFLHFCHHFSLAFLFLLLSSCLLDPNSSQFASFPIPQLVIHFLTAFAFRSSHYFVCHFASALAVLGGHSATMAFGEIVKWQSIEWPRSMAQVVAHWNVPMHQFLHKYVYQRTIHQVGTFSAILLTFLISAALHGLDLQMTAVLTSLGLFAFVERSLRETLAFHLSACIRTKECKMEECGHRYKKAHPLAFTLRLLFIAINIYLLIYLGAPFHGEGQFHGYSHSHLWHCWIHQFWLSGHLICLVLFLFNAILSIGRSSLAKKEQ